MDLTLLIPAKPDPERDAVAACWERAGGRVMRLDRFWEPPPLDRQRVRLYGNDTFCHVVAQKLQLGLLCPPDDLLLQVPSSLTRREIRLVTLEQALGEKYPKFVKPLVPKLFRAGVFELREELSEECRGLEGDTPVLVAQVVPIFAEARAFVLDGCVQTCSLYEGLGSAPEAASFLNLVAPSPLLPKTCVLDAALLETGWALLEANATWGAGLNGCDAAQVTACLLEASHPLYQAPPHFVSE